MKVHHLDDFVRGWFIGPFTPTLCPTDQFECAVQRYSAGDREAAHVHKVATEYTIIAEGTARMNGAVYERGAIVVIPPGQATDFEAVTDVTTFVVKVPAVKDDKYPA
jgi:quercetin dioxygenase-like cupin family protein